MIYFIVGLDRHLARFARYQAYIKANYGRSSAILNLNKLIFLSVYATTHFVLHIVMFQLSDTVCHIYVGSLPRSITVTFAPDLPGRGETVG